MRTMFRKYGLWAALTAVLLLSAALVIGCIMPVDGFLPGMGGQPETGSVPAGTGSVPTGTDPAPVVPGVPAINEPTPTSYGYVSLNLGGASNARATFLPATISYDAFLHYRLIFTANSGAGETGQNATVDIGASSVNPTTGALLSSITLVAGKYDSVAVTAYTTAGAAGNTALGESTGAIPNPATPVAKGTYNNSDAGFTVTTGTNTGITIPLAAIIDGDTSATTKGILTWNVTNSISATHTPTAATVTITPAKTKSTIYSSLPGTALGTPTVNLYTTAIGNPWTGNGTPVSLDSGYYFVDFKVTAESLTATQTHLVHIYQNMTTPVTGLSFTDDHFGGFVGPPTGGQGGGFSYTHPSANPLHIDIDPSGAPGITGNGATGTTPYLLTGTGSLVITIDETDLDEYTGILWLIDGEPVTTGLSTAVPGTAPAGATLTLTRGQAPIAAPSPKGYYALTVSGLKNGTPLENEVPIYIQVAP